MILGDVEEVITTVEIDDETYEEIIKVRGWRHIYSFCSAFFDRNALPQSSPKLSRGGPSHHQLSTSDASAQFFLHFFFWSLFRFFFSNSAASRSRNSH